MKQVISSLSPEFTTVTDVDTRKYYGVKFGNSEQTFPKLLLVHQDYFNVLRFDGGIDVGGVSFLLDKKFTQLKTTIDFLLSNGYGVYEFGTFAEWYLWYSGSLKPAVAPVLLKPKKISAAKPKSPPLIEVLRSCEDEEKYFVIRRGSDVERNSWLRQNGTWDVPDARDGLDADMYFPTKAKAEQTLESVK